MVLEVHMEQKGRAATLHHPPEVTADSILTLWESDHVTASAWKKKEKSYVQNNPVFLPCNHAFDSFDKTLDRYHKGCLSYYAQYILRVVQTAKRTPCIIPHTSWIPGERVYDVGVFRVLDIYKYTQRLSKLLPVISAHSLSRFLHTPAPSHKRSKAEFHFCYDDHDSREIAVKTDTI